MSDMAIYRQLPAIWFHSSVKRVAAAGISATSPTSPCHTNPPPPAKPPSVKNVNGSPYGKKQSEHQAGLRKFAILTATRIEAAAMTHHWNLLRVVSPPILPATSIATTPTAMRARMITEHSDNHHTRKIRCNHGQYAGGKCQPTLVNVTRSNTKIRASTPEPKRRNLAT